MKGVTATVDVGLRVLGWWFLVAFGGFLMAFDGFQPSRGVLFLW